MSALIVRTRFEGISAPAALVRLTGNLQTLGAHADATLDVNTMITWTREISEYGGTRWNGWRKFVAQDVAGITWQEFREQVLIHNPSLRDTGGQFVAGQLYFLPENCLPANTSPLVAWEREVVGSGETLWACWQHFVQGKVLGLSWNQFSVQFGQHNPGWNGRGAHLLTGEIYHLPLTLGIDALTLASYTDSNGLCRWDGMTPGVYQITVQADQFDPWTGEITISEDGELVIDVELTPAPTTRAMGFVEIKRDTAGVPRFFFNDRALPFIGVNLRGLLHYGGSEWQSDGFLQHSRREHIDQQLQHAQEMGARVIRVFTACKHISSEEVGNRLQDVLDRCQQRNMFVIAALTDLYNDTPFHPQGDDHYYTTTPDGYTLLNEQWFRGDYKRNYLPFVDHLVTRFRGHPALLAWEIGNELKLDNQPEPFMRFVHDVARFIRQHDGNHLITTGVISTHHVHMKHQPDMQRRLYQSPDIDFLTIHAYNRHWDSEKVESDDPRRDQKIHKNDDSQLAAEVRKPFIVEEAGFDAGRGQKRNDWVYDDLAAWFDRGAQGYMQWGFMATDFNNGDGDEKSGMDRGTLHDDWNELFSAYRTKAGDLGHGAATLAPTPSQTTPSASFKPNQVVYTTRDVNLRHTPDALSRTNIAAQIPPHTDVTILGESTSAGGYVWWRVRVNLNGALQEGWMAQAVGNTPLLSLV